MLRRSKKNSAADCPDELTLERFLRGELSAAEADAIRFHLSICPETAALLESLREDAQFGEILRESHRDADAGLRDDLVKSALRAAGRSEPPPG